LSGEQTLGRTSGWREEAGGAAVGTGPGLVRKATVFDMMM
jgi:hypothetical protein